MRSTSLSINPRMTFKKAALALIACVLFAGTALFLTACKPPEGQLAANATIAEISAIDNKDPESMSYLPEVSQAEMLEQIGISQQEFFDWWLDGFKYSLGDVNLNPAEDDGQVDAKITCRQLEPIIKQWSNEYIEWLVTNQEAIKAGQTEDPCEYGRLLLQSMFETTEPVLLDCTIWVQKYDDTWSVVGSQDNGLYRDALLGSTDSLLGYYSAPLEELKALNVTLPVKPQPASEEQAEE